MTTSTRLPAGNLLALMLTSFVATANETMAAGLLPQIARDLAISQAGAGQLVTFCALGSGLAAVPLTAAASRWRRRAVLLAALATFLIGNLVTAVSPSYALTLVARLLVGLATGVVWTLLAGYARGLVEPVRQGRALALAMAGIPLALALGMPLSSWFGALAGWRSAFAVLASASAALMLWVYLALPDFAGEASPDRSRLTVVLGLPGIRPVLLVIMLWILAHYTLYTYIAPFLAQAGLASSLESVLLIFGLAAVAGIWVTGVLIDRHLRRLVLFSLAIFGLVAMLFGIGAGGTPMMYGGVLAWGLSFGGAPTLLQTALADTAGSDADAAQSILVTVFNFAFAASGVLGGVLLQTSGVRAIPWALVPLLALACLVAYRASRAGFRAGQRGGPEPGVAIAPVTGSVHPR
jgi:predicted MFS family arabinose efflux permease